LRTVLICVLAIIVMVPIIMLVQSRSLRKQQGRTWRKLITNDNIWNKIDEWAAQNNYSIVAQDDVSRTYEHSAGFYGMRYAVRVTASPGSYLFEAWLGPTMFNKIMSFNQMPEEMILEGTSHVASVPRNSARNNFNRLLGSLGLQAVQ
jgi:hypothetical protein